MSCRLRSRCLFKCEGNGVQDRRKVRVAIIGVGNCASSLVPGVVIDAVRCAKLALDRGIGDSLVGPSSDFMKSPSTQFTDDEAKLRAESFIRGDEPEMARKPIVRTDTAAAGADEIDAIA